MTEIEEKPLVPFKSRENINTNNDQTLINR
jgi:hypothetical protein